MIPCQTKFWLKPFVGVTNRNSPKVGTLTSSSGSKLLQRKSLLKSTLAELFLLRGDAYMKAGHRAEALADYRRVKSDAWSGDEKYLPRHLYFNARGSRNFDQPEPWPTSAADDVSKALLRQSGVDDAVPVLRKSAATIIPCSTSKKRKDWNGTTEGGLKPHRSDGPGSVSRACQPVGLPAALGACRVQRGTSSAAAPEKRSSCGPNCDRPSRAARLIPEKAVRTVPPRFFPADRHAGAN